MYYHKYLKYKTKYLRKKQELERGHVGNGPRVKRGHVGGGSRVEGDPQRERVPDSYANYPPSPAGARALQSQLYRQMGNAADTAASKSQKNAGSSSFSTPADPQRAGEIVEGCLTNCMKDCNYGFPLCISTNMGSFAQTARNLQNLMGAQRGPPGGGGGAAAPAPAAGAGAGAGGDFGGL